MTYEFRQQILKTSKTNFSFDSIWNKVNLVDLVKVNKTTFKPSMTHDIPHEVLLCIVRAKNKNKSILITEMGYSKKACHI